MTLSDKIKKDIREKKQRNIESIEYFKEEILVTDALKEDYDDAVKSIDIDLLTDINTVNDTLYAVADAYQDRIDSGCRSDLYWRITGYVPETGYSLIVEQLSPVGIGTSIEIVERTGGIGTYSDSGLELPGIESDNLHGIKYYWQPYLRDIGDTTIGEFIGFVGTASTVLSVISQVSDELIKSYSIGNLVTSSKSGVFPGSSNKIVGFGTTTITGISTSVMQELVGVSTTSYNVSTIILENSTVGFASLPEGDGSYVQFKVVTDPNTFEELIEDTRGKGFRYKIEFTKNPFSPEKIGILSLTSAGYGLSITYDNSGRPPNEQSWKPEFQGIERGGEIVKEPKVGAGRVNYVVGFTDQPVVGITPASKGTTLVSASLVGLYAAITPPSGCTAIENRLTNAISARDAAEANLSSSSGCITNKVDAANAIREERSDYALKIWTLRQSIGGEVERADKYEALEEYINQTETTINGSTESCL